MRIPILSLRDSYVWYYIDSNADTGNAIAGLYSINYGRSKVPVFDGNSYSIIWILGFSQR